MRIVINRTALCLHYLQSNGKTKSEPKKYTYMRPVTRIGTLWELLDKIMKMRTKQAQADTVR